VWIIVGNDGASDDDDVFRPDVLTHPAFGSALWWLEMVVVLFFSFLS